ncbi:hypothetical protein HVPorG_04767 [Roseomonas mucosa]|nr:hypothetical protein HVPorG_04767 [Roseomonas mucosa]UZO90450.1 hypothetical protein RMP42_04767 [Roseomonas mucosa]
MQLAPRHQELKRQEANAGRSGPASWVIRRCWRIAMRRIMRLVGKG